MILLLRGHIRSSFNSKELYNFISILYELYPDLKIFIHTWNIIANNISWRNINVNNNIITEELIRNYFGNLSNIIKHIIIDNDKQIELIGNLQGKICKSLMPTIGWKNYWYGKYKIIEYIHTNFNCYDEMVINTRFDLFSNSNNFNIQVILELIAKNNKMQFHKNIFLFDDEKWGIDNIYIGNVNTMYKLIKVFHYQLDELLIKNPHIGSQEFLVFRLNNILFN
jgi:hypothetical protein